MAEPDFTIWRQDDNGVRAKVGQYPCREDAEQARHHYESLGHKQLYWIEPNHGSVIQERDTVSQQEG